MKPLSVLVPAYNPGRELLELVTALLTIDFSGIIIVNDGSKLGLEWFDKIKLLDKKIIVLAHSVNLGKGAALKTGLNYIYSHFTNDIGVVTADADGQHLVADIVRVGEALLSHPDDLILGTRHFDLTGKKVPLRSRFGNVLTTKLFKLIIGQSVTDTQSGLRGIPYQFIPALLTINNSGYEFELSMLIACKYINRTIREVPIRTVYIENNKSSHFNPILDSLKIYFVLFRFMLLSLLTATLDFTVFFILSVQGAPILTAQLSARIVSVLFNYPLAKRMVFHFDGKHSYPFFKYITLVIINCVISFITIDFFVAKYAVAPVIAKIVVESTLFLANFAIQRDFIFTKKTVYET